MEQLTLSVPVVCPVSSQYVPYSVPLAQSPNACSCAMNCLWIRCFPLSTVTMWGGGFPRGFMYDSDEEMEMEIEYLMRHAERYAGRAQPASSCSTGAYTTQQTGEPQVSRFHWLAGFPHSLMITCLVL